MCVASQCEVSGKMPDGSSITDAVRLGPRDRTSQAFCVGRFLTVTVHEKIRIAGAVALLRCVVALLC